jgi:hypothetical protein
MKEITDEYLLSLVQKEEYAVMGGKLLICTLITRNGSMVCGDPVFIGNFDKAKEATKKNALSKLKVLEEYLVRDKMNQVSSVGCFLAQTQRSYLDLSAQIQLLCSFIGNEKHDDKFDKLSQAERELILEQHEIMHKFSRILLKRINAGK